MTRRDRGRGRAGSTFAFSPTRVANLKAWFRADKGITLNGSTISQWSDQSGQSNHVVQGTPASQPGDAISVAALNGRPAIQLAPNQFLRIVNFTGGSLATSTIYVVGVIINETRFWVDGGGGATRNGMYEQSTAMSMYAGAVISTATVAGATGLGFWARGSFLGASSTGQLSVNTKSGVTVSGNPSNTAMDGITIGLGGDGTGGGAAATLSIAEVIIYQGFPAAADRTNIANYIRTRYGLT